MQPKRLFVAGSTGATGRVLVSLCDARGVEVVPHVRPKSAGRGAVHPKAAVFELSDTALLTQELRACSTVLQLIGTTRQRFGAGDTYETSDIGTTRQLVEAAKPAGVRHLVLLSSVGAGKPRGAYLRAKAKAEQLVRESGLAWTVFRPSFLEGEGRRAPPGMKGLTRLLGLSGLQPIRLEELAEAMIHCALEQAPTGVALEGDSLWEQVRAAQAARLGADQAGSGGN